ncbi:MAG: MgtC/SapB family protein [Sphaerochaeta sp.]
MKSWFFLTIFDWGNYLDFLLRLIIAAVCGGVIGQEREKRFKNAGLRTHIIVAIASSLMMIISKYAFFDVVSFTNYKIQLDASRIAASVIQAIGFLGAGVIFVRKESVIGLTTAAGLWATVGIGLAIGSGLIILGVAATVMIILIQAVLHHRHDRIHSQLAGTVTVDLNKCGQNMAEVIKILENDGMQIRNVTLKKTSADNFVILNVVFCEKDTIESVVTRLQDNPLVYSMEIYPVL